MAVSLFPQDWQSRTEYKTYKANLQSLTQLYVTHAFKTPAIFYTQSVIQDYQLIAVED